LQFVTSAYCGSRPSCATTGLSCCRYIIAVQGMSTTDVVAGGDSTVGLCSRENCYNTSCQYESVRAVSNEADMSNAAAAEGVLHSMAKCAQSRLTTAPDHVHLPSSSRASDPRACGENIRLVIGGIHVVEHLVKLLVIDGGSRVSTQVANGKL